MNFFCIMHYICTYIYMLPQLIKLIKTKSSNDYSLWQIFISLMGSICWFIYIFTSAQNAILYINTIIELLLIIIVDFFILKYYKRKK